MTESLRRLAIAAYAAALFFVLSPVLDVFVTSWPLAPWMESWRFGFVGILANYLVSVLFGMLLAMATAAAMEHRAILKVSAWLTMVLSALILLLLVSFVLDTLQLRSQVNEDAALGFKIGAVKTALKVGMFIVAFFILALAGLRSAKELRERRG